MALFQTFLSTEPRLRQWKKKMRMEAAFADIMEKFVTPITVLVGLLGNGLSICVLRKKEIQVRRRMSITPNPTL